MHTPGDSGPFAERPRFVARTTEGSVALASATAEVSMRDPAGSDLRVLHIVPALLASQLGLCAQAKRHVMQSTRRTSEEVLRG